MKITIDTEQIDVLKNEAGKIVLTPDAEDSIIDLLSLQAQLEEAVKDAKSRIEVEALKVDPNFSTVHSDKLRIGYRSYGSRYVLDESRIDVIPRELVEKEVKYKLITDKVNEFIETHGQVPLGIEEPDRKPQVSISIKDNE